MHSLTFDSPSPLSLFLFLFLLLPISQSLLFTLSPSPQLLCLSLFLSLRRRCNRPFLPLVLSSFNLHLSSRFSTRVSVLLLDAVISSPPDLSTRSHFQTCSSHRDPSSARVGRCRANAARSDSPMNARERASCALHLERISNRLLPQFVYDNYHN